MSVGNLIAAVVMDVYLWRTNPGAATRLNASLRGEDDLPSEATVKRVERRYTVEHGPVR